MTVTVNDMAKAYTESVKQRMQETEDVIRQNQEHLKQLRSHYEDCMHAIAGNAPTSIPAGVKKTVKDLGGGVTQETFEVPNPFEGL